MIVFYISPILIVVRVAAFYSPNSRGCPARAMTSLTWTALFCKPAFKVIKSQRIAVLPKIYAETAQKFSVIGRYSKSLLKT